MSSGDLPKDVQEYITKKLKHLKKRAEVFFTAKDLKDLWWHQRGLCAISGIPMRYALNNASDPYTASVDRIDCNRGYVLDNIQWVLWIVNSGKGMLQQDAYIDLCKHVAWFADRPLDFKRKYIDADLS